MITSAIIYNLTAMPGADFDVLGALGATAFVPCGATQELSAGWVPPREEHGPLCECINGQLVFKLMIETKKVPADVLSRRLEEYIKHAEADTGRKPGKMERRNIKDELRLGLLPAAFPSRLAILAWIDPIGKKLVVGTSAQAKADRVATGLVAALPGLELALVNTKTPPRVAMTEWLRGALTPETLVIESACELKSSDERKTKVSYRNHDLDVQEVKDHLEAGMTPVSLELTWLNRVSFTLTDSLVLKKFAILDDLLEGHPEQVDAFDADVVIATTEINGLIADLITELDGDA